MTSPAYGGGTGGMGNANGGGGGTASGAQSLSSSLYDSVYFPVVGANLPSSSGFGAPRSGGRSHQGLDIMAPRGSSIVAAVSGKVVAAEDRGAGSLGGVIVTIEDQYGNRHYYAHMDPRSIGVIRAGMTVQAGQLIGYVGNTGNAANTPPHLHYSINEGRSNTYDSWQFLSSGNLQQADIDGLSSNGTTNGGGTMAASSTPNLPSGGEFYHTSTDSYVVYTIQGSNGAQAYVYYRTGARGPGSTGLRQSTWDSYVAKNRAVDGGSDQAFVGLTPGTSWDEHIEQVLFQMGIAGTDALSDAGVLEVIAEFIARPDMEPAELQNRLKQTDWFNAQTDRQRGWNDLGKAEQDFQVGDMAAKLVATWFTYTGEELDYSSYDLNGDGDVTSEELKRANPNLYQWAFNVASGASSEREAVEQWIKPAAKDIEDSPWNRSIRDEEKAKGAHDMEVDNAASQVQALYEQWGVQISPEDAVAMGSEIAMNKKSLFDVLEEVKDMAISLYPNKHRDVPTTTWAKPFMSTMSQLMETGDVSVFDNKVQTALTSGQSLADFRKSIKGSDQWLGTKNARDEMFERVGEVGRMMGFA